MSEKLCFISEGVALAVPEKPARIALSQSGDFIVSLGDAAWTVDDGKMAVAATTFQAAEWMEKTIVLIGEDDE